MFSTPCHDSRSGLTKEHCGASPQCFGRRCGFWLGTCTAKRASTRSNGASLNPFSTPAPTTLPTCANNHGHLRRKSTHLVLSNSSAHEYAFYCIFAHFMCSSPFLKTWKSTPMRPGRPAEPLSVRLILKREGHIRRWMVEKRGDDAGRQRRDEKRNTWEGRIGRRRGDGGIRVSANASREGRRVPGRDDGACLSAS